MATAEILNNILEGNIHMKVAPEAYDSQVKPIAQALSNVDINVEFEPSKHLAFKPEHVNTIKRTTMEELGATAPDQISEIAVSEPFPLFTDEAVEIMRAEIMREDVFSKWARRSPSSTTGMDCVIRGYAKETCPLTYAAWNHPKTLAAVSSMAGVELEIVMDYEVAHINMAMKSEDAAMDERLNNRRKESMSNKFDHDVPAVVDWHRDSYPYVCVLMMSDTTHMIGGETLIRTGHGEIVPAAGPAKGKAVVLQGRKLLHLASTPLGHTERITAVTSFRAKDPTLPDTSVLTTVKPEWNYGSLYDQFYPEWIDYRMKVISDRADAIKKTFNDAAVEGKRFDKEKATEMLKDLEHYLNHTFTQMEVEESEYLHHENKICGST